MKCDGSSAIFCHHDRSHFGAFSHKNVIFIHYSPTDNTSNLYASVLIFILFINILDHASNFIPRYLVARPTLASTLLHDRRWIVYSSWIVLPSSWSRHVSPRLTFHGFVFSSWSVHLLSLHISPR